MPAKASCLHDAENGGKPSATPRLALNTAEAASALGVCFDTFHEQIAPELRVVRVGRRKLIPVAELERWLDRRAEAVADV